MPRPPENTWTGETDATETDASGNPLQTTDPTVASAGLTELEDRSVTARAAVTNGHSASPASAHDERPPSQAMVNGAGANPLAQANWENQTPISLSTSTTDGWVNTQAPPEKGPETSASTGQGPPPTQLQQLSSSWSSWAEDIPIAAAPATNGNSGQGEGFEQVVHHARQDSGRGRGGSRGRGPRGDGFRGRGGYRGDFRGRGRGRGSGGRGRGGPTEQGGSGPATPPAQ